MTKILIVEDSAPSRDFLASVLRFRGYEVMEATNGQEALLKADTWLPDLIITDVLMPVMDGYMFVSELRSRDRLTRTPVVFWSAAYHEPRARKLAQDCGVVYHLSKPATPEQVIEMVDMVLAEKQSEPPAVLQKTEFNVEHSRLLTDKLTESVDALNALNSRLFRLLETVRTLSTLTDSKALLELFLRAGNALIGASQSRFTWAPPPRHAWNLVAPETAGPPDESWRPLEIKVCTAAQFYGTACFFRQPPAVDFAPLEMELVSTLGRHAAVCLESVRLSEQVRASLAEKTVLLQEIHHRVKNNLQIICSLLAISARHSSEPAVCMALQQSRQRVASMALIHERLYRSERMAAIDFNSYIVELARQLVDSYSTGDVHPALQFDLDTVLLPLDQAIPCGLILNELLTNCLIHAFDPGQPGKIAVSLSATPPDAVTLCVRDNGVGLPEGCDFASEQTMGLRIINLLARQLNADLTVNNAQPGTAVSISFRTTADAG